MTVNLSRMPGDFPFSLLLNLACWRCERWRKKAERPLQLLGIACGGISAALSIDCSESGGCWFSLQTRACFWHQFPHSGNICLPERGEYPEGFVWMEVIHSTHRVTAGTGRPPRYQSRTWSGRCCKRLVVGGSPVPWPARRAAGWKWRVIVNGHGVTISAK